MATSGILMFAKHRDAEVASSKMFQARTVRKKMDIALIQGKLEGEGSVDVPLITDWENRPRQIVHFDLGKPAQTLYQALEYCAVEALPVFCSPQSQGVHISYGYTCNILDIPLQAISYIILNRKKSTLGRMALHASYLAFTQPLSQVPVAIRAQLPF